MPTRSRLGWSFLILACAFVSTLLLPTWLGPGIAVAAPGLDDEVKIQAKPQRTKVRPGDQFAIAVTFEFAPKFHIWPNQPVVPKELDDLVPIPTTITLPEKATIPAGVRVFTSAAAWPKPHEVSVAFTGDPLTILSYSEPITVFIPVAIGPNVQPGALVIPLVVSYQACNDTTCLIPAELDINIPIEVVAPGAPTDAGDDPLFRSFDPSVFAGLLEAPSPPTRASTAPPQAPSGARDFGLGIRFDPTGPIGLLLVLLVAFVGGIILNLTPCVLPIIPIKILGLQQAAGTRRRMLILGAMTFLGVVFFWLVLGALIAFGVLGAISEVASFWWFNLAIAAFMFIMALGMLGSYTVGLPNWVYSINPDQKTSRGAFQFGILSAILATPCVAPLAGGAAAWILTQPSHVGLLVFLAIGCGMGLPYFVLTANPRLVNWIPRAGPGSELLKQVLGFFMLAVAVFFAGTGLISLAATYPYLAKQLHWWALALVMTLSSAWMIYRGIHIARSPGGRVAIAVFALVFAGAPILWAVNQTRAAKEESLGAWADFDPAAVDAAAAAGKVVVLDFTAEWCLICKTLEATVLRSDSVRAAIAARDVVTFKVDLTSRGAPGWARLKELKEAGIPLLVVSGPGLPQPWKSNAYTPAQVVQAIQHARGPRTATR